MRCIHTFDMFWGYMLDWNAYYEKIQLLCTKYMNHGLHYNHVMLSFKYVLIVENISNVFIVMVMIVYFILFCVGILLSYLTHSLVLFIFLQVIMLKLFSFCLQVLDVVDFVAAQEEIFWSTSCRVFCSFLYNTSTMNRTCLL